MYQAKALPHLLQQLHRLPPLRRSLLHPSCCWARCPRLRPGQVTQKLALNSGKGAHAVSAELKAMRPTALSVHSACVAPCRNTSLLLLLVTDANACCDVNMYPNKGLDSQFDNTHRRHCRSKTLFGTSPRPPRVILVQPQARIGRRQVRRVPVANGWPVREPDRPFLSITSMDWQSKVCRDASSKAPNETGDGWRHPLTCMGSSSQAFVPRGLLLNAEQWNTRCI